jgi:hypothetical protein
MLVHGTDGAQTESWHQSRFISLPLAEKHPESAGLRESHHMLHRGNRATTLGAMINCEVSKAITAFAADHSLVLRFVTDTVAEGKKWRNLPREERSDPPRFFNGSFRSKPDARVTSRRCREQSDERLDRETSILS